jgi:tetratricopeptide (TPR) repeat protein
VLSLVAALALALAGDAAPPPTPDDLKVSEGHFNQGEAYYRAGEWSKARTEFQASYEISRLDLLLFNIAQTYIKEGDSVRAIAALKAYLKTTPSDADAQAKLASLEAALPQSAQAPPSQTQPRPPKHRTHFPAKHHAKQGSCCCCRWR